MSKVLVTGASGFIGKQLVPFLLEQGHTVRCLVRATSNKAPLEKLGVELATGDLSDQASLAAAMQDMDIVYHLAGQIYHLASDDFMAVNEKGTVNVLEAAAAQAKPPVVIATSSLAAAGARKTLDAPKESDPVKPVSDYGRSKVAMEKVMRRYADKLPITVMRPPMVLGGGDTNSLPLFESVGRGIHPTIDRSQLFSIVYVKDLVRMMVLAAENGERLTAEDNGDGQGIYFTAYETPVTWVELGRQIAVAMDKRAPINIPMPAFLVKTVGALLDRISNLLNRTMPLSADKAAEGTAGHWVCDTTKIHTEFNYEHPLDLQAALKETVAEYKALGKL